MALEYEDWKDNWSSQIPAEHLRSEYEFAVLSAFKVSNYHNCLPDSGSHLHMTILSHYRHG